MRAIVASDEYCYRYDGKYWLSDYAIVFAKRYLAAFDHVTLAYRVKDVFTKEELGKSNNEVNLDCVDIMPVPFFQRPLQFSKKCRAVMKAVNDVHKHGDVVFLRLPSTTALAVWMKAKTHHIPWVVEVIFDCKDALDSSDSLLEKFIWWILHRLQVNICHKAIGVSCVTAEYLQRRYYPTGPNALVSHYSSIELTPDFFYKSRTFTIKKKFTIVHVSRWVQNKGRKGHNELIEALHLVKVHGYDVSVVFVGEDYLDGISQLEYYANSLDVASNVKFTGYLSNSQLRKVMLDADIAVLPTKAEGLPRVVIEAMAMGLPVITTPVSGNPELVRKELLINYDDVTGFARAIERLITDKTFYEEVSRENFDNSQEYSCEILNQRRTDFYKKVINAVLPKVVPQKQPI